MTHKINRVFLLLIIAQAAHSVEEYYAKLYEVLAPARFVARSISVNPALGFAIANTVLVAFGAWCWAIPVRRRWHSARHIMWAWGLLEMANGIGQ